MTYGTETIEGAEGQVEFTLSTGDKVTITPTEKGANGVKNVSDSGANSFTWTVTNENCYTKGTDTVGTLTINPVELTIVMADRTLPYTGSEQYGWSRTDEGKETVTGLVNNETVTITYTPSKGTTVGEYNNGAYTESSLSIKDGDTDVTGNYTLKSTTPGKLTITASTKPLAITSSTKSWTYDGQTHTDEVYTVTYDGAEVTADATGKVFTLSTGDTVTITPTAEGVKDYSADYDKNNTYTYVLVNADSYSNVTANVGTLSIEKRPVTLTSETAEKPYDGTPLTKPEVTVGGDGFVEGEATEIKATGSVTTVAEGEVTNTITYTEGTNFKADNYTITKTEGKLKITASTKPLVITSSTKSWTYDGQTHTDEVYTVTYDGTEVEADSTGKVFTLSTNDTVTITATAEGVKDYSADYSKNNTYTYVLTNASSYSSVTVNVGTLSIDKREVTLTSGDAKRSYNGEALTNADVEGKNENGLTVETGWVDGEGATYEFTGSQTLVGESPNAFTYTLKDNTKADNYVITKTEGKLIVDDESVPDDLVVKKTADDTVYKLGEEVTFDIWVKNIYDDIVTIKLIEIEGVTLAKDTFEGVEPGAEITTTATYTITEADILAGSFTNTVTAKVVEKEWSANASVKVEDPNGHLTVIKETTSETPEGGYKLGETVTYKITVVNDGNLTITDITATDERTGDEWKIDSLAPGESKEYTASTTVTEDDILSGHIINDATAKGKSPDPDEPDVPVDPGHTDDDPEDPKGHLTVIKETTSETPEGGYKLGETLDYKITVVNDGNLTITEITVTDERTGDEWKIDSLAPGESKEYTASTTVTEGDILSGHIINEATAKGKSPDPDEPDVPVTPGKTDDDPEDPNGHLTVNKETTSTSKDEKGYAEGEVISYKITVVNDGNLTITGINVIDPLTGDKWPVESLAPGATKEFETSYTVTAADAAAGEVLNVATAEGKSPDPKKPDVPVTPGEDPEPTIETKFTLIIRYWIGSKDGELIDTVNRVEKAGTAYDVATPPKEGYTADTERVKGVLDKDMEYDVVYTAEDYTLTILYVYQDGTEAAETYTEVLHFGDEYSVESPVINGYYTNKKKVEGTMPARDVTVTVIYVKNQVVITIDDFETPLGLGLGGINVGETIE